MSMTATRTPAALYAGMGVGRITSILPAAAVIQAVAERLAGDK